jgi:sigma-B regulation protein RsbU (phosphoserine phosphatase)
MYEPAERTLYYANAGHAPVIYRPCGSTARLLEADGVPMGVLEDTLCTLRAMPMGPGDLLVLATDGFNEALGPSDEMFSIERLLTLVDAVGDQPVAVIAEALFTAVAAFSAGREQSDDQTIVVVKGVPRP